MKSINKKCDIHPLYLKAASTVPAEEYSSSKSITTNVLERREVLVDELTTRGAEVLVDELNTRGAEVLVDEWTSRGAEGFGGREDVWFILLDVIPRGTTFVPPGISKLTFQVLPQHCAFYVVILALTYGVAGIVFVVATSAERDQKAVVQSYPTETAGLTVEDQREVVVKETRLQQEETTRSQTQIPQPESVLARVEDDWFMLFNVVPRKPTYVSPGTARIAGCASDHD